MADNVVANSGAGGATFATDDIGGVHYPISKAAFGALDSVTLVGSGAGLPMQHSRPTVVTATWDSTTVNGTTLELDVTGYGTAIISTKKTGTIDTGQVEFEIDDGATLWPAIGGVKLGIGNLSFASSQSLTLSTVDAIWIFDVGGMTKIRVRLSTAITNTGTLGLRLSASSSARAQKFVLAGLDSPLTVDTELPTAVALADTVANPTVPKVGAASMVYNGSTWDRMRGDTTNGVDADVTRMPTGASGAQVQGTVADDTADSENPVGVGGTARQTNRTSVTDGDRVRLAADDQGRLVVVPGHVRDLVSHQHTQIASSSSETTIVTATASEFHDLVCLVLTNQTATAVNVTIKDSTAGTTRMIVALAANGGAVIPFPIPLPQLAAVNNNWTATLSSAAVTVNILAQFIKNV